MSLLMNRILIVDDDGAVQYSLSVMLKRYNYTCLVASSGAEAIGMIGKSGVDLVLLDLVMPELDGLETLSELKKIDPDLPVVMITGRGDIDAAVRATKLGAYDFIAKPVDATRLVQTVQRAIERFEFQKSVRQLEMSLEWIFGKSSVMGAVIAQIRQTAWGRLPVTLQGEAGTGKSVVARVIHNLSKRGGMAFRSVKADAMSTDLLEAHLFGRETGERGMLERARGGTIFIDGLDSIPLPLQARLAGFINGKEDVRGLREQDPATEDARVILGIERPLKELISEKRVCEEMGECLSEPPLVLPPLAGRAEDIGFLVNKFLWKYSTELDREIDGLEDDVVDLLVRHNWPDNLRELENVIRDSVLLTEGRRVKRETVEAVIEGRVTAEKISSRHQNGTIPGGNDGGKTSGTGPGGKGTTRKGGCFFQSHADEFPWGGPVRKGHDGLCEPCPGENPGCGGAR